MAGRVLWNLAGKHAMHWVKNVTGLGKRNKKRDSGSSKMFEIEGEVNPCLEYADGRLFLHKNCNIRARTMKINPNVEVKLGSKNVVSYEFQDEDITNCLIKGSFDLDDDSFEVDGRCKFMSACEIGGLVNFASKQLGGRFALNHQCLETSTHIKSKGIKVKVGIKIHKDLKFRAKAKHTSEIENSIVKLEIERDADADFKQWYSLNTRGIIKAKLGLAKQEGGCKLKGKLDFNEWKYYLGIQCDFGK